MMNHWLRVELDEETGKVSARAFASAPYGPEGKQRPVTVHQDVEVPEALQIALHNALKSVLDAARPTLNRELRRARAAAELVAETRNEFEDKPKSPKK